MAAGRRFQTDPPVAAGSLRGVFVAALIVVSDPFRRKIFRGSEGCQLLNPLCRSMFRVYFLFCMLTVPDCHTKQKVKFNKKPCIRRSTMLQYNKSSKSMAPGRRRSRLPRRRKTGRRRGRLCVTGGRIPAGSRRKGGVPERRGGRIGLVQGHGLGFCAEPHRRGGGYCRCAGCHNTKQQSCPPKVGGPPAAGCGRGNRGL